MIDQLSNIQTNLIIKEYLPQHIFYDDLKIKKMEITANLATVALEQAVIAEGGLIFGLSTGACLGILAGVAIVVVGGVLIYKLVTKRPPPLSTSPLSTSPSQIPSSNHYQESKPVYIKNFSPLSQAEVQSISTIGSKTFINQYQQFKCPITHALIREPFTLKCGHDFQKQAVKQALKRNPHCPKCRRSVHFEDGVESQALKKQIERFRLKAQKKGKQWVQQRINEDFTSFE